VPAAAKAAGIAARTAYAKVKNAREEMEAAPVDEGVNAEDDEKDVQTEKKSKKKKASDTTRSNGKRKRSDSEDTGDTSDVEPAIKKEKADESIAMVDGRENKKDMKEETSSEQLTPCRQ